MLGVMLPFRNGGGPPGIVLARCLKRTFPYESRRHDEHPLCICVFVFLVLAVVQEGPGFRHDLFDPMCAWSSDPPRRWVSLVEI